MGWDENPFAISDAAVCKELLSGQLGSSLPEWHLRPFPLVLLGCLLAAVTPQVSRSLWDLHPWAKGELQKNPTSQPSAIRQEVFFLRTTYPKRACLKDKGPALWTWQVITDRKCEGKGETPGFWNSVSWMPSYQAHERIKLRNEETSTFFQKLKSSGATLFSSLTPANFSSYGSIALPLWNLKHALSFSGFKPQTQLQTVFSC